MTKVIHIRDGQDTPDEVYIGRGSMWGNPFKIGRDGDRAGVIEKYRDYAKKNDRLLKHLEELRDKTLMCFCKPHACHGDVLIEMLEDKPV
tara:strand:- start:1058 stop:1327 length:270 start_codon:yes stop_codon:yes gene_type:complete